MLVMAMSSSHLPSPCRPRSEPKGSARVWRPKQKASSTIVYGNICHTLLVPPPTSHYVFRFLTFFLLVVRARRSLAFGAARLERRHRHINNPLLRYMSYIIKGCREKHSNTIAHHPVVKPPAAASHGSVAHSNWHDRVGETTRNHLVVYRYTCHTLLVMALTFLLFVVCARRSLAFGAARLEGRRGRIEGRRGSRFNRFRAFLLVAAQHRKTSLTWAMHIYAYTQTSGSKKGKRCRFCWPISDWGATRQPLWSISGLPSHCCKQYSTHTARLTYHTASIP